MRNRWYGQLLHFDSSQLRKERDDARAAIATVERERDELQRKFDTLKIVCDGMGRTIERQDERLTRGRRWAAAWKQAAKDWRETAVDSIEIQQDCADELCDTQDERDKARAAVATVERERDQAWAAADTLREEVVEWQRRYAKAAAECDELSQSLAIALADVQRLQELNQELAAGYLDAAARVDMRPSITIYPPPGYLDLDSIIDDSMWANLTDDGEVATDGR